MNITTLQGDCRETLKTLPDASVQCVVTSPPYFGLRSYNGGTAEIGLEQTPAAYVAALVDVFREVWRVLRDDGTCWLNLGDSYASSGAYDANAFAEMGARQHAKGERWSATGTGGKGRAPTPPGLKPKDLIGIPWMVADALKAPRYTGQIAQEIDRVWLAAMIDAEGSINGFTHERKDDGRTRTGIHIQITNSNRALLDNAHRIWPASLHDHGRPGDGHLGLMETWRWIANGTSNKMQLISEIYPYLIAKKQQAMLAYNFLMLMADSKKTMRLAAGEDARQKRAWIVNALSELNHGQQVITPSWCIDPPSMYVPGWYLRSDIIWAKPNCMPESVTDRPTRSHEYIFLLTKQSRYYYDADAVREPLQPYNVPSDAKPMDGQRKASAQSGAMSLNKGRGRLAAAAKMNPAGRNKRTVWTVPTSPYAGAHFATFPEKLIEPCILAGSSPQACEVCGAPWRRVVEREPMIIKNGPKAGAYGSRTTDGLSGTMVAPATSVTTGWQPTCRCENTGSGRCVILDPFGGSGTTARVAIKHGRDAILCELNGDYIDLQEQRTNGVQISMEAFL